MSKKINLAQKGSVYHMFNDPFLPLDFNEDQGVIDVTIQVELPARVKNVTNEFELDIIIKQELKNFLSLLRDNILRKVDWAMMHSEDLIQ